jgi:hypothetical protein
LLIVLVITGFWLFDKKHLQFLLSQLVLISLGPLSSPPV